MASLVKQQVVQYVDADGKRVKKGTAGAKRVTEKSRKWYRKYRHAQGVLQRVPLCSDKSAAQSLLNEMLRREDRKEAGLADPYEKHRKCPLGEHIEDYRWFLRSKGDTEDHVELTIARIETVVTSCGFKVIDDLSAQRVSEWLYEARRFGKLVEASPVIHGKANTYREIAEQFNVSITTVTYWRQHGAPIVPRRENDLAAIAKWRHDRTINDGGMSITTSNHYFGALKSFGKWLVRNSRTAKNEFEHLSSLNAEVDIRHERRSLADEDFRKLITATRACNRTYRGLTGVDRATAVATMVASSRRSRQIWLHLLMSFHVTR